MPRVSIVIPTWERGRWLGRALDSVFAQSAPDFEVLVVDDGSSTDAAEQVLKMRGDARARYLRLPEHRGVAAARNAGVLSAMGAYIAFLDDDDEWLPQKLERQLAVIENCDTSVAAVYTARFSMDTKTGRSSTTRFPTPFRPGAPNVVTTSSVLVRRDCFSHVGMFDERFEAGSDADMWIRLGLQFRLEYIDAPLVKYYTHANRLSTDYGKKRRAVELLLDKHQALFAQDRRLLARQYVDLSVLCYRDDSIGDAWRAFWRAVRLCPFELATYARGMRTFLNFRTLTRARRTSR